MKKFEALYNMTGLVVPFIVKDEKGNVVIDQSIVFNQGSTSKQGTIPANFMTNNPEIIKYLQSYGGNEANGGQSFKEIAEKKEVAAKKEPVKKEAEPTKEEPGEGVSEDKADGNIVDYPEATTVQMAGTILRGLFTELTSRDVNNKVKVLEIASSKNLSFSNLK